LPQPHEPAGSQLPRHQANRDRPLAVDEPSHNESSYNEPSWLDI
jgi:hypothetical protein